MTCMMYGNYCGYSEMVVNKLGVKGTQEFPQFSILRWEYVREIEARVLLLYLECMVSPYAIGSVGMGLHYDYSIGTKYETKGREHFRSPQYHVRATVPNPLPRLCIRSFPAPHITLPSQEPTQK